MKKDESLKANSVTDRLSIKNGSKIQAQKSQTLRTFLGCDTCKLKNCALTKKNKTNQDNQIRVKKCGDNNQNGKKKIKLTDLCEEDKKRIVELMEELSKFAEKNKSLKESLDMMEKAKQEQHECLMKQTNLHLEEKNIFLKEIQTYKARLEVYENEMKEKMGKWESRERFLDGEIRYLAKALQKSFNEKTDLMKEISHLKSCLKQSLESFELLRNEVSALQGLSVKTTRTNSRTRSLVHENMDGAHAEESEEELLTGTPKENSGSKGSLDVINNKLEQLYHILQTKSEKNISLRCKSAPCESEEKQTTCIIPSEEPEPIPPEPVVEPPNEENKSQNKLIRNTNLQEGGERKIPDTNYKFLKPFNEYNKTSIQAERILKKFEKPFNFEYEEKSGSDNIKAALDEDLGSGEETVRNAKEMSGNGFLHSATFNLIMDENFDEDRLLSDLFYSGTVVDLGIESALLLANREGLNQNDLYF